MLFVRLLLAAVGSLCFSGSSSALTTPFERKSSILTSLASSDKVVPGTVARVPDTVAYNRRDTLRNVALVASSVFLLPSEPSSAAETTSSTAEITDKIFINIKGIPGTDEQKRIVIGLFGKDAPNSVTKLKDLVTRQGLPAPCRPKPERSLQREQLEGKRRLDDYLSRTYSKF